MEVGERVPALERDERDPARAQQRFEIRPGRVDPLRSDLGSPVQDVVEDLDSEVGLGDLVHLGEGEGEAQAHRVGVLSDRAALVPDVPAGFLDQRQEPLVLGPVCLRHGSRGV